MSNLSDASRLKATVFVGGLDQAVTQQTLYHAFLPFGDIVEVNLPKPDLPGAKEEHRGFGYVEFETAADANDAIDNMDRSELYGQVIKVANAKPQKDASEGLGSKTAVWEQVCIAVILVLVPTTNVMQEGWLAKHAVSEEDRQATEQVPEESNGPMDPMQGLEGLDEAGPKPA
jgi:RNA recognition motif-containing protein